MAHNQTSKIVRITVFAFLFLFVIGYAIFNSRIFIAGPQIEITSPQNGSLVEDSPLIQIEGVARNIAYLWLNNKEIYTDENGLFKESLLLHNDYNIIKITTKDRFEREITQKLQIVYSGPSIGIDIQKDYTTQATSTDGESEENKVLEETATSSEEI